MLDFRKKNKIKKVVYSPFFLIFLFLAFSLLAKGVWNVYVKERLSVENLQKAKTEYGKMIARKDNLISSIEYLNTEDGVESEIRSKFRAIKDGEKVMVIIDNFLPSISPATTTTKGGFWYNLFH